MKILLYEHISSGGLAGQPLPSSLLCEGYAMLRGIAQDFKSEGHNVTVLLDSQIARFNPPLQADTVTQVGSPGQLEEKLQKAMEVTDAAYIIAPEAENTLYHIVRKTENAGVNSLNCPSTSILHASDKSYVAASARRLGLNFPKTIQFNPDESTETMIDAVHTGLDFPLIIKPSNGAGCGGLSVVQDGSELEEAIIKVRYESENGGICAQEFIQGIPASVSLLCKSGQAIPVSLNLQDITLTSSDGVSSYNGGLVPFEYPLKHQAFAAAKNLAESISGLRGYVGIDIVLAAEKLFVIEVNPRLTTSYIGLRKVANTNISKTLIQESPDKSLQTVELNGVCCFSKVPISRPIIFAWQDFCAMEALISPPFPLYGQEISYGMLLSYGETTEESLHQLHHSKEELKRIWEKGQHPW